MKRGRIRTTKHFLSLEISEECGYCYTVGDFLSVYLVTLFYGQSKSFFFRLVVELSLMDVAFSLILLSSVAW